jgi:hypothetical protein
MHYVTVSILYTTRDPAREPRPESETPVARDETCRSALHAETARDEEGREA